MVTLVTRSEPMNLFQLDDIEYSLLQSPQYHSLLESLICSSFFIYLFDSHGKIFAAREFVATDFFGIFHRVFYR